MVTHKQPVQEEHSEVQRLIGAGYTKDESITAIERWGTAAKAMEHLLAGPESDGLFGSTAPVQAKEIPVQYQTEMLVNSLHCLCVTNVMCGVYAHVHRENQITMFVDPNAEGKYLMLEELGWVLRELSTLPGMYV